MRPIESENRPTPARDIPTGARGSRYLRAQDVLPAELLDAIQGHVESIYLWIPSAALRRRRARDVEVMRRRASGESIHAVALAMGLTARRICQIQKRERRSAAMEER